MVQPMAVTVVVPVFDDWEACATVLGRLDAVLAGRPERFRVLLVDDGSTVDLPAEGFGPYAVLEEVAVLRLRRNLGHQRAIAVGLVHVHARAQTDAVVVMDGDGQDRPEDVPRLLDEALRLGGTTIVFAERTRRSESLAFRAGYLSFRLLHAVLVGRDVRMGNFSVVPRERLDSLVVVSELWNHYAAAAVVSRQPFVRLPTMRGDRVAGESQMNWTALVVHGLSAISVFSDRAGVRLLGISAAAAVAATAALLAVLLVPGRPALPGRLTALFVLLLVLFLQASSLSVSFVFAVLGRRERPGFLPQQDAPRFVRRCDTVWPRAS